MLMYGKEERDRKQEIDRQHHTIPTATEFLSFLFFENIIELTLSTHRDIIWVDKVNS